MITPFTIPGQDLRSLQVHLPSPGRGDKRFEMSLQRPTFLSPGGERGNRTKQREANLETRIPVEEEKLAVCPTQLANAL